MQENVSLYTLTDQLIKGLLPADIHHRNLIVNDIDRELVVQSDENMLAYILGNLLNRVVDSTQETPVHVESLLRGDYTVILLKDPGTCFYRSLDNGFRQVQEAAEKLGGSISVSDTGAQGTLVTVNLSNHTGIKKEDVPKESSCMEQSQ